MLNLWQKIGKTSIMSAESYNKEEYTGQKLEYGKYLVVRKDGKVHFEVYNGTG